MDEIIHPLQFKHTIFYPMVIQLKHLGFSTTMQHIPSNTLPRISKIPFTLVAQTSSCGHIFRMYGSLTSGYLLSIATWVIVLHRIKVLYRDATSVSNDNLNYDQYGD